MAQWFARRVEFQGGQWFTVPPKMNFWITLTLPIKSTGEYSHIRIDLPSDTLADSWIFAGYQIIYFECYIPGTRHTLEVIKRRLQSDRFTRGADIDNRYPLFKVDTVLVIPKVTMLPSLEDVQTAVTKAVQCIVKLTEHVPQWEYLLSQQQKQQKQVRS